MDTQSQTGFWHSLQSSCLFLVRSLVMLGCLVSVPVMAVFGGSLPNRIRAFLNAETLPAVASASMLGVPTSSDEVAKQNSASAEIQPAGIGMGLNIPTVRNSPASETSEDMLSPARPPWDQPHVPNVSSPSAMSVQTGEPSRAARYEERAPPYANPEPSMIAPRSEFSARSGDIDRQPYPEPQPFAAPNSDHQPYALSPPSVTQPYFDAAVQPASAEGPPRAANDSRGFSPSEPSRAGMAEVEPLGGAAAGWDLTKVQARLQALGASYYRLETWGGRELYRFHCRVQVRDSSPATCHFESLDPDPLQAMLKVLHQIETWRTHPDVSQPRP